MRGILGHRFAVLGGKASGGARTTPEGISYNLESPNDTVIRTASLVDVSGWACAPAGIARIEVYFDGVLVRRLDHGLPRPDVAAGLPALRGAARSGFSGVIDISAQPPGEHALLLVIHDQLGHSARVERVVERVQDEAAAALDVIRYNLDSPGSQTVLTTGQVVVAGWACSPHGIAAVEVCLGDELLKRLDTGLARPDVGAVYPEILDSVQSGFAGSLNLNGERYGEHTLVVVIRDRAGNAVRRELTVRLVQPEMLYQRYFLASLPTPEEEQQLLDQCGKGTHAVSFDLCVQVGQADAAALSETIGSIVQQAYPHWRVRLHSREEWVKAWPLHDERITVAAAEDLHATPSATAPVHTAFLRAGEILAPAALSRAAAFLTTHPHTELLYSDHDRIKPGGLHVLPAFKPNWSPDHLLARNYVGGIFFVRQTAALLDLCGELLASGDPAWRFDLLLRVSEAAAEVGHLPEVLWSQPLGQQVEGEAELNAVRAAVRRRGWCAEVLPTETPGVRRVRWHVERQPKVSIIIPTTGNPALVRTCVDSLAQTRYPDYELIFIDNGRGRYPEGIDYLRFRGAKVLERNEPFNWARLNNIGARAAVGELLLFLNDDIEVVDPAWLDEMVSLACRDEVGGVGAMLVYPDDRIQHAGVFLVNHGGGARHLLSGETRQSPAYEHLDRVVREVSCNTGACLMMRRSLFERLGGFDESLAVVGNDIDLCLRAAAAGHRNLWTPHAVLIHHESVSRREINILDDEGRMWERWGERLRGGDPFYNVNLSPYSSDCTLNLERLKQREQAIRTKQQRGSAAQGVNLIGFIKAEMGVGEAMRGLAAACDAAGVAFDIYSYEHSNPGRMGDDTWAHKVTNEPRQAVNLLKVNADLVPRVWSSLPTSLVEGRYAIGFWVWELPEFPDEWTESFRFVNEIWAPSGFVQEAIALKAPVPVVRIPYVVEKRKQAYLDRHHFALPDDAFLFLMMYDVLSVTERKNPGGAIEAFKRAFGRDDARAGLVIKINHATERELSRIGRLIEDHPHIHVVGTPLSRYEVDSLIHGCDAFVSLHRAEGFGLALAEAMALERPVIATHWSGNTDFMHTSNSACVDYRLVTLDRDHGPYQKGQQWADPDLEHAAWWMRKLREDGELRSRLVKRAARDVAERLSARRVGERIAGRLRYIRAQ